jgi:transcriptional regulator with XRE-family HTH domain
MKLVYGGSAMNNLNVDIGKRIALLRKERNLTQEQLAEKLDISIKHCSCVERGVSSLSLEKFIDLCEILDTNLDYLIRGKTSYGIQHIPETVIRLLSNDNEKEASVLKEYLSLYSKIRQLDHIS